MSSNNSQIDKNTNDIKILQEQIRDLKYLILFIFAIIFIYWIIRLYKKLFDQLKLFAQNQEHLAQERYHNDIEGH